MPRPGFVIIGAMKAGTTALYAELRRHPGIYMPDEKELDYFLGRAEWRRGPDWYDAQFAEAGGRLAGEASPNYTKLPVFPGVFARMAAHVPDARLIYLLREPVARMRSHYLHQRAARRALPPIEQALLEIPDYLHCSSYGMQLEAVLEHYPREQVLLLRSEDLERDPAGTLERTFAFLGVPALASVAAARVHTTAGKRIARPGLGWADRIATRLPDRLAARARRMTSLPASTEPSALAPDVVAELHRRLRPDVERLAALAGPGFEPWGLLDHPS
jgi:hypothetical protein